MRIATDTPRIYVASLADYNNGILHGIWIDLDVDVDADEIQEQVNAMLATSREGLAEEWAIHDYEGFDSIRLSEWETFTTVAEIANGLRAHGTPYAVWYADDESNRDVKAFEQSFIGDFEDAADYAYRDAEESGLYRSLSDLRIENYVDWERYGDDLLNDLTSVTFENRLFVWDSNR